MSFSTAEFKSIAAPCKKEVFNPNLSVSVTVDANGDTSLHRLIRHSQTAKKLTLRLCMYEDEIDLRAMSQILNNQGESVFDILKKRGFKDRDTKQLLESLKIFNSKSNFKSLDATISANSVLKTIDKNNLNIGLINNIELACEAVNQTRQLFNWSSSHPTLNNKSDKLKLGVQNKVDNSRESKFSNLRKSVNINKDYLSFKQLIEAFEESKSGNCDEYAYATAFFVKFEEDGYGAGLNVEICSLQNGDHVFVIIGRDPLSALNDEATWGNQAIVCDAWSLSIFPAYELENKLRDYQCYKDEFDKIYINMIFSFNRNFHKLETCVSFTPELDKAGLKVKKNLKLPKIAKIAGNSIFNQRKLEKPVFTKPTAAKNLPKI